jgi:hypothetical protein
MLLMLMLMLMLALSLPPQLALQRVLLRRQFLDLVLETYDILSPQRVLTRRIATGDVGARTWLAGLRLVAADLAAMAALAGSRGGDRHVFVSPT